MGFIEFGRLERQGKRGRREREMNKSCNTTYEGRGRRKKGNRRRLPPKALFQTSSKSATTILGDCPLVCNALLNAVCLGTPSSTVGPLRSRADRSSGGRMILHCRIPHCRSGCSSWTHCCWSSGSHRPSSWSSCYPDSKADAE